MSWPWETAIPPVTAQCPSETCRSPHWRGVGPVYNAILRPGRRAKQLVVGATVECVKCGTVYNVLPEGVAICPIWQQPVARMGPAGPPQRRAPRPEDYGTDDTTPPEPDMEGT